MIWLLALTALAQVPDEIPALNTQYYRVPLDAERTMWTDDTGTRPLGYVSGRVGLGYMHGPFGYWEPGEATATNLVEHALQLDLVGTISAGPVRLGWGVPVNLRTTSDVADSVSGLGDLAVDVKATLVDRESKGVGFALGGRTVLPTAATSKNPALGLPGVAGEFQAIVDGETGPALLALNVGARFQPRTELLNTTIDDQVFVRAGVGYAVTEDAGVSIDVAGNFNLSDVGEAAFPFEAMIGGYKRVSDVVVLRGALSRGLTLGIGAPVGRAVLMISLEPPTVRDADGDGIVDKADACPHEPEDPDGFEDANGCPDPDNDGDGLLDAEDQCPDVAEDLDGFRDDDGCIDPETPVLVWITDPKTVPAPAVGVISGQGMAAEIGNYTQLDLNPGSYTVLADAPGFESLTATIEVPEQTEPFDVALVMQPVQRLGTVSIQVTDPDGNPVEATWQFTDQPQRRVSTEGSEVSQLPGTYNVLVRSLGYGSVSLDVRVRVNRDTALAVVLQPSKVTLTVEKIDIKESVFFDTNRATIKRESFGLLDEVAIL
ncbi:MAG: hypothetical protein JRI25_16050, partial [Deltaproteobacteria bacterium]|nr:hypothetical protein [Deltaproteobacteria bacterium]